jgi:hypothetical protein
MNRRGVVSGVAHYGCGYYVAAVEEGGRFSWVALGSREVGPGEGLLFVGRDAHTSSTPPCILMQFLETHLGS